MRDALKNLFNDQIVLADKSRYFYTINPFELKNALGNMVAVLKEYHFTKDGDSTGNLSCKLYRTNEGNWYDLEESKNLYEKQISRMLKSAIEAKEGNTVLE